MKILLSPAKLMSMESSSEWSQRTQPEYIERSNQLQTILKEYNPSELEKLLDISPKLSKENWERNQAWKAKPSNNESLQAVLAFKGEVYRGLEAESLSKKGLDYLQKNLFILSGLYGLLKPSDVVMPYRLEMGKKLKTGNSKDLYEFWGETLTTHLKSTLKKDEPIINLASKEYFKVLNSKELNHPIIEVDFKDFKDGKLKSIMMYFKNARGKMTRWCAENEIKKVEDLKTYHEDGYEFSEKNSDATRLVFIR
ncbi:peroxide stress protein YaaA [Apibacter sp. HY039]|uniref:peroxide stress protein YaaA n=1 Tax=Apibacter sp. HY039 TaxID=2501476 RepID=UPI000FEB6ABE|nr:peroxide stress protein YaaA [Apibacter sp. HY039]